MNIKRKLRRKSQRHKAVVTPEEHRGATWTRAEATVLVGKEFIWDTGLEDPGRLHGIVTHVYSWTCPCCGEKSDDPALLVAQIDSEAVMQIFAKHAPQYGGAVFQRQVWEREVIILE